jgi:hypothetical protein
VVKGPYLQAAKEVHANRVDIELMSITSRLDKAEALLPEAVPPIDVSPS